MSQLDAIQLMEITGTTSYLYVSVSNKKADHKGGSIGRYRPL